jgi:hypothetical protein
MRFLEPITYFLIKHYILSTTYIRKLHAIFLDDDYKHMSKIFDAMFQRLGQFKHIEIVFIDPLLIIPDLVSPYVAKTSTVYKLYNDDHKAIAGTRIIFVNVHKYQSKQLVRLLTLFVFRSLVVDKIGTRRFIGMNKKVFDDLLLDNLALANGNDLVLDAFVSDSGYYC